MLPAAPQTNFLKHSWRLARMVSCCCISHTLYLFYCLCWGRKALQDYFPYNIPDIFSGFDTFIYLPIRPSVTQIQSRSIEPACHPSGLDPGTGGGTCAWVNIFHTLKTIIEGNNFEWRKVLSADNQIWAKGSGSSATLKCWMHVSGHRIHVSPYPIKSRET